MRIWDSADSEPLKHMSKIHKNCKSDRRTDHENEVKNKTYCREGRHQQIWFSSLHALFSWVYIACGKQINFNSEPQLSDIWSCCEEHNFPISIILLRRSFHWCPHFHSYRNSISSVYCKKHYFFIVFNFCICRMNDKFLKNSSTQYSPF